MPSPNHIKNAPRRARNNVLAILKLANILANRCAANARVALHVHIVAECKHDTLDLCGQLTRGAQYKRLRLAK